MQDGTFKVVFSSLDSLYFPTDTKTKQASLGGQINALKEQTLDVPKNLPTKEQIELFTKMAQERLPKLGFETKRAIVRKLVDKVVASQQGMVVYGYLPLGKEESYVNFWSINRDSWVAECGEVHAF